MTSSARRLTRQEVHELLTARPKAKGRFPVGKVEKRTVDGRVFTSIREAKRYGELKLMERAGEIRQLECQPKFPVPFRGEILLTFTADFKYVRVSDGDIVVEDVKSKGGTDKDTAYKIRKRAATLEYGINVVEVTA